MTNQPDGILSRLEKMAARVKDARDYLKFDQARRRIGMLEEEAARPGFWDDTEKAQEHMRQITRLKNAVEPWLKLEREVGDARELAGMAEDDAEMMLQLGEQAGDLARQLESLETRALMSEPNDPDDAYLYVHAGAGGTESCDWAQMLLRMYAHWAEREGYAVEMIDAQEGEGAGVRSATLLVKGDYAYGRLKAESGIHRLVRISPFDANKRRHTSFCSVYVWPDIDDTIEVEIKDEDLKIETFRATGAGGQHVNRTESAVRMTHLPTKIVASCQNERSQHQNRAQAMKMLRSRLYQHYLQEREAEQAVKESEKKDIGWGNQIRSYVFQPYQMVKDLRTGHETGNIQAVMDGEIEGFIEAWLRWRAGMPSETSGASSAAAPRE
jgi:peptide chain release factor 2